jgi:hypothetical protein
MGDIDDAQYAFYVTLGAEISHGDREACLSKDMARLQRAGAVSNAPTRWCRSCAEFCSCYANEVARTLTERQPRVLRLS